MSNDVWLSAGEAAELLGVHVETLYRLAATGEVTGHKVGARWRFVRDELLSSTVFVPGPVLVSWREQLRAVNPYDLVGV